MKIVFRHLWTLLACACLMLPLSSQAEAGVTGTFIGNGKDGKLAFVNARKGEPFGGQATIVLTFTEKDPGADKKPDFKASFGEYGSALILTIQASGDIVGCEVAHAAHAKKPFTSIGKIKTQGFKMDAAGVRGKVTTGGATETFGQTWDVNLDFDAKVQ